jgi:hypothetical protein
MGELAPAFNRQSGLEGSAFGGRAGIHEHWRCARGDGILGVSGKLLISCPT